MLDENDVLEEKSYSPDKINVQDRMNDFLINELKQRDIQLKSLLDFIYKNLSSILEPDKMLEQVLDSLIASKVAERGIVFINDKKLGLVPRVYRNIDEKESKMSYFENSISNVIKTASNGKNRIQILQEINTGKGTTWISFICLPLSYENEILGVIYLDILSKTQTFRSQNMDIAELFSMQAAISLNNANLYEKIRNQNLELMKLINLKDKLLEDVSKNIREPADEIKNILESVIISPEGSGVFELIQKAKSLSDTMELTIDRVLKIQLLEKEINSLFSEIVDIKALIRFVIETHNDQIREKNISFKVSLSEEFENYRANPVIMRAILDELITNSIYYNNKNGKVIINGTKKGDFLHLSFADNGIGIKPGDREKIFEQFYRSSGSSRLNDKGSGLGLFMVRKFLKYYNGEISVESRDGHGSRFEISLMFN